MAEKAKFDREAAFKSSSEQDARARMLLLLKKKMERKIVTGCSGPIIWIGILIKRCVGWRWRKERI